MEVNATVLSTIVTVLALAIAAYAIFKAGNPITAASIADALEDATVSAQEIIAVVQSGVFAAEQLKATGKIPDNNAAFDYALEFAQKLLPTLDRATLTTFIESSVLAMNQAIKIFPMSKGD